MAVANDFVEIFMRNWREGNGSELERLFKEGPKYFRNLSVAEIGVLLEDLLDTSKCIPKFLQDELSRVKVSPLFAGCLREAYSLLKYLIIEFPTQYRPYLMTTWEVCTFALKNKVGYYIKRAANQTIMALIRSFPDFRTGLHDFMEDCIKKRNLFAKNEFSMSLQVLCTIARYHPDLEACATYGKKIQLLILNYLREACNDQKSGFTYIEMYIESLTDLLHVVPFDEAQPIDQLYSILKRISTTAKTRIDTNRDFLEIFLNFFVQHMQKFQQFIRDDHKYWHDFFSDLMGEESSVPTVREALRIYYDVLGDALKKENSSTGRVILEGLKGVFVKALTDEYVTCRNLRIHIMGYSQLAEPIQRLIGDAVVEEMFSLISRRTLPLFFSEDDAIAQFEDIADYQEALARVLIQVADPSFDQVRILIKICTLLIKRFPELKFDAKVYAAGSLKRTIEHLSHLKLHLFEEFLSTIISDGIVWSCSHALLIDADLQQDLESLPKRPISYKDYVFLWESLLNSDTYTMSNHEKIASQLLHTCITLTSKLDLRIRTKEDNIFSDIAVSQIPENEDDFRIFLNMVDLYEDILGKVIVNCSPEDSKTLLKSLVEASSQYPLVSGFYKLANRLLSLANFGTSEHQLILHFLLKTLRLTFECSYELQLSCIQLVLGCPKNLVKNLLPHVAPVFTLGFKLGLSNYDLADGFLSDLEKFVGVGEPDQVEVLLLQVLPALEIYLRSRESLEVHEEGQISQNSVTRTSRVDSDLELLQTKIFLFFGRISSTTMHQFLHKQAQDTGATWDEKNLLEYTMTFPHDGNLPVYLDTMLPRIIELSLSCSDRRTRIAACESLYSIIIITLGKTMQYLSQDPDRYTQLYRTLWPVILKLGCDSDEVVWQMYNNFTLQMTHWLSSRLMLHSPVIAFLIESIFDGLCDESNSAIKDFSGICLAEFVTWSIKQASDLELKRIPDNVQLVIEHIKNFGLHPLKNRRIAGSIAFNHVYKILREIEEIVDFFWIEFLHCFVEAMNECDDQRIRDALDHVTRVLVEKSAVFTQSSPRRRVPKSFNDGSIKGCVQFLLNHCIDLDTNSRKKCMELYEALTSKIGDWSVMEHDMEYLSLQQLMLGRLEHVSIESYTSEKSLKHLIATLDTYIWLINRKLIEPQVLLVDLHPRTTIFSCLQKYIRGLNEGDVETFGPAASIKILDFMVEILPMDLSAKREIHGVLFDENFCVFIGKCIMNPTSLGFDDKHLKTMRMLPKKIGELVETLWAHLSSVRIPSLLTTLDEIFGHLTDAVSLGSLTSGRMVLFKKHMQSLVLMKRSKLLAKLEVNQKIKDNSLKAIDYIFEKLKTYDAGNNWCAELTPDEKFHFEALLELSLNNATFARFIESRAKDMAELLNCDGKYHTTHGEHFFIIFKDVFVRYLLDNIDYSMTLLIAVTKQNPNLGLFMLNEIATWLQHHKKTNREWTEQFFNSAISKFSQFCACVNNFDKRKKLMKNIYRIVIRLMPNGRDIKYLNREMFDWILDEFQQCQSMSEKTQILNDFLIGLVDDSDDAEISVILRSINIPKVPKGPDGHPRPSLEPTEIVECFQCLITALPITKSLVLLEAIARFAMRLGKYPTTQSATDHLMSYFNSITDVKSLESLERIHRIFMSSSLPEDRLDLLRYFLIPAFRFPSEAVTTSFFERNVSCLVAAIVVKCPEDLEDRRRHVVSQIEAFNLLEIMFCTLNLDTINDPKGVISTKISEVTKSSNEVLGQLFRLALDVRKTEVDGDNREMSRLLHCAAFNCAVTMVTVSKGEKSLRFLFAENPKKEHLLWERIIDCTKSYTLAQTFKELPKQRKILVNIKKNLRNAHDSSISNSYLRSYNLASSTLTEDIAAYDMHGMIPLAEPAISKVSVTLEADDLNDHECMGPIVGVLRFITEVHPSDLANPPAWLTIFSGAMLINQQNVRLFLLKIILNTQEVFKPFASLLLRKLLKLITSVLKDSPNSYVITDAMLMLIDWAEVAVPGEDLKAVANDMIYLFVEKVDRTSSSDGILRYNYSIIEMLVKSWQGILDPPISLNENMKTSSRETVVRLIFALLQNGLGTKLVENEDVLGFLLMSLAKWKEREEHLLRISGAVGLFLKFSAPRDISLNQREEATVKIREVFRGMQEPNRLIKCLHAMCKAFPGLLYEFYELVSHNHLKINASTKVKSMELFLLRIPELRDEEIESEINYMKFQDLLQNKVLACEKICLEVILNLVPRVSAELLLPMADLAGQYCNHEIMEYRELVYSIFMDIFKKYIGTPDNRDGQVLLDLSQRILLAGLLDQAESLQQRCMNFWIEEVPFGDNCTSRIFKILNTYSSEIQNFLPIFGILFLSLSKKSPNYETELFIPLDKKCNYKNYKIATGWRLKNLNYRVPLFVSSYASQCSQRFTLASLSDGSCIDDLRVRATNPLEFEPTLAGTYVAERNPDTSTDTDDVFVVPAPKLSRRFKQARPPARNHLSHEARQKLLKHQTVRQRSSIKLSRAYRIGELPDISITHEAILNPLQELIKKDPLICKTLIISIISALMKNLERSRDTEMRKLYDTLTAGMSEKLEFILLNPGGCGVVISAALEIILANPKLSFTPAIVAHVAESSGLEAVGGLLIERALMVEPAGLQGCSKRPRLDYDSNPSVDNWIHLGELYQSINDVDTLLSVFCNHMPGDKLNSASSARSRADWTDAKALYQEAIVQESGLCRRHCQSGLFESLSRLSDFEEISTIIEGLFPRRTLLQFLQEKQGSRNWWITPWYFTSKIYQSFTASMSSREFLAELKTIVETSTRKFVEELFTEELAGIYPTTMNEHAKLLVLSALKKTKDRWSHLNRLSVQLRLQEVVKLRGVCDSKYFRDSLTDLAGLGGLLEYWERSIPSEKDDLLSWDKQLAQRTHITNVLLNKLEEPGQSNPMVSANYQQLSKLEILQKMALIRSAYTQKNCALMKKYMEDIKDSEVLIVFPDLGHKFRLNIVQIKLLRAQLADGDVKMKNLRTCREKSQALETIDMTADVAIENLLLMADWAEEMINFRVSDEDRCNRIISRLVESSYLPEGVQLDQYLLDRLRRSIRLAEDERPQRLQECHLKMLKYCNRILTRSVDLEIVEDFVTSTLRAMSYGSVESVNYFPCVLREEYLGNERVLETFRELTRDIATWKFLKWQPQLLVHLATPLCGAVESILERLADDYPNTLFYSLQSTLDAMPDLHDDAAVKRLLLRFDHRQDLNRFVQALEYLIRPELYLIYQLDQLVKNLHLGTYTAVDKLIKKVYELEDPSMQGSLYKYIAPFKNDVIKIRDLPSEEIEAYVKALKTSLNMSLTKKKDSNYLKDYSPYLSHLTNSDIEIPGFCSGDHFPDPRYRPRIIKIESKVQVMRSTRKPIRITFIGDDTKSYHFLVKFGEDLRLDQRLQQTFMVMNEVLRADLACAQRNLSIRTFRVIPISACLGLIEWVDNTRTLQEFIEFSWKPAQTSLHELDNAYESFINACSPEKTPRSIKYREAVSKISAEDTISQMTSLINKSNSEALRRTLQVINPSAESFVSSRRNFVTSYSVMCLAQWVLGIGDRHLENTLINVSSGECTGIDFASAFGGGIDQSIPELMPFRLTNQIVRLMKPFDEGDLFSVTMVHVLKALREHRGLIAAVLEVIIQEKLNWMQYKGTFKGEDRMKVNWMSKKKIESMMRKLEGDHPSEVMVDDLREQHLESGCFEEYSTIIRGSQVDDKCVRTKIRAKGLTVEEQVKCLLEQATDLNVLGRTYVGWRPYL